MPVINTPWNRYEIVLLIDTYERIKKGEISKKDGLTQLSQRLRARVISQGATISDEYRNENGMDLQMKKMAYALTDGEEGIPGCSEVFNSLALEFHTAHSAYEHTLKLAEKLYPLPTLAHKLYSSAEIKETEISEPQFYIDYDRNKIHEVLAQKFAKGFRMDSTIDLTRFKKLYSVIHSEEISFTDESLRDSIRECGIENGNRLYLPENVLQSESRDRLISYIESYFENGGEYIYYSALLESFESMLLDSLISDKSILRKYLQYYDSNNWFYSSTYLAINSNIEPDPDCDIAEFIRLQGEPVDDEFVVESLPCLTRDFIRRSICNQPTKVISNGRDGKHFHIDNFKIDESDKCLIKHIIEQLLSLSHFTTLDEVVKHIAIECKNLLEDNCHMSQNGIKNAIRTIFNNDFDFSNKLISVKGQEVNANMVFAAFCKNNPRFDIKDLSRIVDDLNFQSIPFDIVYGYAVRLSHDDFIRKDLINFDIEKTDKEISTFIKNEYANINEIETYTLFPSCGFQWNVFLLESYLTGFSRSFGLLHHRYNKDCVTGAIVKRPSKFENYDDLLADLIAHSDVPLFEEDVLDYLKDNNFIIRRSKKFLINNPLLEKAKVIRNKL